MTTGDVAAADAPDAGADGVAICAHCGTRRTPNLIDAIDYVQCSVEGDLGCGSRFLRGPDGLVFDPAHPRVMPDSEQEGLSPLLARIRGTGPAPPVE